MILSAMMLCMSFYNTLLRCAGFDWISWAILRYNSMLGDSVRPKAKPPHSRRVRTPYSAPGRKRKLLLAALSLFAITGQNVNGLRLSSEKTQRNELRQYRGFKGELVTTKMDDKMIERLRQMIKLDSEPFKAVAAEHSDALYSIVDTGCSESCTNCADDFEPGTLTKLATPKSVGGIAGSLLVEYEGLLCWETLDDEGNILQFKTKGLLVPELPCRLFSPQSFLYSRQLVHSKSCASSHSLHLT